VDKKQKLISKALLMRQKIGKKFTIVNEIRSTLTLLEFCNFIAQE
jgi:hypothetical protein